MDDFKDQQTLYFDMQKKFFEYTFRKGDDMRQAEKGQPSLENEDTGYQWKNDE